MFLFFVFIGSIIGTVLWLIAMPIFRLRWWTVFFSLPAGAIILFIACLAYYFLVERKKS